MLISAIFGFQNHFLLFIFAFKMKEQEFNYERIARAIEYIISNFKSQPSLDEIAKTVHLSPFHFQRLFSEWAGTTPKKFLQFISIEYAKQLLNNSNSIPDVAYQTGLSGTGRLHDLFISIEGMTPAEYRDGGRNLLIEYTTSFTPFGRIIIASTEKGICHLAFFEDEAVAISRLTQRFPDAIYKERKSTMHENAVRFFSSNESPEQIKLHLKGTAFQLKVWQALLKIPQGGLTTYGRLSELIGNSNASRAVGSAVGSNPVAFIIPYHRVIQASGIIGGYMWVQNRKTAIIGWEAAQHAEAASHIIHE